MTSSKKLSPITFKRAFGAILPLCLVALLLSGVIISIANDMYAFVKPDTDYTLALSVGTTTDTLSYMLEENDIIENAFAFEMYLISKKKADAVPSLSGEWQLSANMSYRELVGEIFLNFKFN